MDKYLFNLKYIIANRFSNVPTFYNPISRILTGKDYFANKKTDVVIDGFPRCANTYATFAFKCAQKDNDLIIGHHVHKISRFLIAKKYNIPAILLIRNPIDCISSLLIRQPLYDPRVLFKEYYYIYFNIYKINHFVVADFNDVKNDYGNIIKNLNSKFNSNFNVYYKNELNEEKIKLIIQSQDDLKGKGNVNARIAYPNKERLRIAQDLKATLLKDEYKEDLKKCNFIYNTITNKFS